MELWNKETDRKIDDMLEDKWGNNMRQGWCKKTYPNGATYEGDYLNDKRHGYGIKTCADGVVRKLVQYQCGIKISPDIIIS
mgnify:CR=1 FL=1